jgi:hypothetical protein
VIVVVRVAGVKGALAARAAAKPAPLTPSPSADRGRFIGDGAGKASAPKREKGESLASPAGQRERIPGSGRRFPDLAAALESEPE